MNKKQFAILSSGNISNKDEGIALYASNYIESNYSFSPSVDIIHGDSLEISILNILKQYEEVLVLDVIGIDDTPGSLYHFPMDKFRGLGTNESSEDMGVLECLNMLERRGEVLPHVSLLAIVPDSLEKEVGLSPILKHSFEAFQLLIVKTLENKGISNEEKDEKVALESLIESMKNKAQA